MKYPNNIRELRKTSKRKIDVNDIAAALGVSPSYVYKIESGDRDVIQSMIRPLAELFGVEEKEIQSSRDVGAHLMDAEVHEIAFNRFMDLHRKGKLKSLPEDLNAAFIYKLYLFGLKEKQLDGRVIISSASALQVMKEIIDAHQAHQSHEADA